jgi:hypothetical protein
VLEDQLDDVAQNAAFGVDLAGDDDLRARCGEREGEPRSRAEQNLENVHYELPACPAPQGQGRGEPIPNRPKTPTFPN